MIGMRVVEAGLHPGDGRLDRAPPQFERPGPTETDGSER